MGDHFSALAAKGVQQLHAYQPGKPIEDLQREYGLKKIIKLASNENPLGSSPKATKVISQHVTGLHRYPDGNGFALKQALSKHLNVDMNQITLGNGSSELAEIIARTFVNPENEVIFSQYGFAMYPLVTQAINAKAVVAPAKDWGHDLDAMLAAITAQTRVIFIANPNNPTGTWLAKTPLQRFLSQVPDDVIVVLDEAYYEYVEESDYPDGTSWLSLHPNLIVTRTFSKIYGLAGLRVGYAVSHPDVAELLNRVRQPFNVNLLAQQAAIAALYDQAHVKKSVTANRVGLQHLQSACNELGLETIPSVGNFLSIDVQRDGRHIFTELLKLSVIVRPLAEYGIPNHIRVTAGLPAENTQFISALKSIMS